MSNQELATSNVFQTNYLLDNAAPEASARLAALAELYDLGTERQLRELRHQMLDGTAWR